MEKKSKLWKSTDKNGSFLFTPIPNVAMQELLLGFYKPTEVRIILYICRMSFAFKKRQETCYLGLTDFAQNTAIPSTHVCSCIKKLLRDDVILRHSKNGELYKYSLNLLKLGCEMKHFRIGKPDAKLDDGYYKIGEIDDLDNLTEHNNDVLLYSKKGYKKSADLCVKSDINSEMHEPSALKCAPTNTSDSKAHDKIKSTVSVTKPIRTPAVKRNTMDESSALQRILASFKDRLMKDYTPETIVNQMQNTQESIHCHFKEVCDAVRRETGADVDCYQEAVEMYKFKSRLSRGR